MASLRGCGCVACALTRAEAGAARVDYAALMRGGPGWTVPHLLLLPCGWRLCLLFQTLQMPLQDLTLGKAGGAHSLTCQGCPGDCPSAKDCVSSLRPESVLWRVVAYRDAGLERPLVSVFLGCNRGRGCSKQQQT